MSNNDTLVLNVLIPETKTAEGGKTKTTYYTRSGAAFGLSNQEGYKIRLHPCLALSGTVLVRSKLEDDKNNEQKDVPFFGHDFMKVLLPGTEGTNTYFHEVGVAFPSRDGKGFNIPLKPGVAISGDILIMPPIDDEQQESSPSSTDSGVAS